MSAWLLLILHRKDVPHEPAEGMREYAIGLATTGKGRGDAPLHAEAKGARVQVRAGRTTVMDGPFAEAKEVVAGYFVLEAETREEALALAARCPEVRPRSSRLELHAAPDRELVGPVEGAHYMLVGGRHFMLLLYADPKQRAAFELDDALKREPGYAESASLATDPKPARLETREGRVVVTDGPFAEAREVVGGYFVVKAPDRAAAVAIAARCPHARRGTVEVREIEKLGGMT
jgi:hypothetical protein